MGDTLRHLTDAGLSAGSNLVPKGAVIISTRAPIGYVAIADGPTAFNQGCRGLVLDGDHDARFVRDWLWAQRDELQERGSGSTFMELTTSALMDTLVPLRSARQQRRVADFLDDQVARIDSIVAARRSQMVSLEERFRAMTRASILASDLDSERRMSKLPWADSIPQDWGEPRICQVATMGTGHTPSRSNADYWIESECTIPWLTTGDVRRFRHDEVDRVLDTSINISAVGLANSAAVVHPRGTVALSRTASPGFSIVMDVPMATSQDFATWTPGPLLESDYLLWCLRVMRPTIMGQLAIGSTHKTIYFPDLMSIRIPLPPVDTQQKIAASVQGQHQGHKELGDAIEQSIAKLAELKRSLITAAVTGEFDVSSADGSQVPVPSLRPRPGVPAV